jgi:hypothetical protein
MKDMQHLESQFPTATGFDWEMFRIGWEAGAKWGECNPYKAEQARNTWNSPESRSIAGSTTGPLEDWRAK